MTNKIEKTKLSLALKKITGFMLCLVLCLLAMSDYTYAASKQKNVIYLGYAKKAWRNEYTGFDTLDREEYLDDIANSYTFDDPNAVVYRKDCISSFSDLETMLHTGNYVFINTHGSNGGNLALYNAQGYPCGDIIPEDFSTVGKTEYSNVKCCVIMACYSANGSRNICKNIYNHGAKCVADVVDNADKYSLSKCSYNENRGFYHVVYNY